MTEAFNEPFEIFHGSATAAQARVYARIPRNAFPLDAKLAGTIAGPFCIYAETLSATMRFKDRGHGESILAEAMIPDPCFWSPQLPFLYQVTIELRAGAKVLANFRREYGVRQLGARGKHLYLEGKRWVPRGVWTASPEKLDLAAAHAAEICVGTSVHDSGFFDAASKQGVLVMTTAAIAETERLPFAAVAAVCHQPAIASEDPRFPANVLKAQYIGISDDPTPLPFAEMVVAELDTPSRFAERFGRCDIPVVVRQLANEEIAVSNVRQECDKLQARMAPHGEFSGFFV